VTSSCRAWRLSRTIPCFRTSSAGSTTFDDRAQQLADHGAVEGGLILGDTDPLHIEIYEDGLGDDGLAWSTALRGFADLTTYDLISPPGPRETTA
jgi:hypothetical protein